MALRLPSLTDTFKVVLKSPIESAVTCSDEEYQKYLESLDESYLKLSGEPTRFVMRKVLPAIAQAEVTNSQFEMQDGEMKVKLGFIQKEVQASIVDIENPSDLPPSERIEFKRQPGLLGGLHDDIFAQLGAAGVVMDLYRAKQSAIGSRKDDLLKKK